MTSPLKKHREYVTIHEGDVQNIAADAYSWGNRETGGPLYGSFSHGHRLFVMAACPAGPKANRAVAHLRFDIEYVTALNRYVQENYGIQYIGTWHSHHSMGIDHPSQGDKEQNNRLAGRCNIEKLTQLVLTRQKVTALDQETGIFGGIKERLLTRNRFVAAETGATQERSRCRNDKSTKIKIDAFIYDRDSNADGPYARCPIKILPGSSPIKTALDDSGILDMPGRHSFKAFPLERIIYDELRSMPGASVRENLPYILAEQLNELSSDIAGQVRIYAYEKTQVILSLPLPDGHRISVVYAAEESPPKINSVNVFYPDAKAAIDLTKDALEGDYYTPLGTLRERVENKVRSSKIRQISFSVRGGRYFGGNSTMTNWCNRRLSQQ